MTHLSQKQLVQLCDQISNQPNRLCMQITPVPSQGHVRGASSFGLCRLSDSLTVCSNLPLYEVRTISFWSFEYMKGRSIFPPKKYNYCLLCWTQCCCLTILLAFYVNSKKPHFSRSVSTGKKKLIYSVAHSDKAVLHPLALFFLTLQLQRSRYSETNTKDTTATSPVSFLAKWR